MLMPGRKYQAGNDSYRYGFQNQEIDKELWDGAVNFNYRVEDPRLVRFFSVDPLAARFPWNSPYAFSENRLIDGFELEGLEFIPAKGNTPGRMMMRAFAYTAKDVQDKWNNSRAGRFTNGLINTTFGVVGTIGSIAYMTETGGTGAALGGSTALMFSLGEIGIGITQMTDAIAGKQDGSADFLHNSSSIPGLIAYGTGSKYAPFIDAFGQFSPTLATSIGEGSFKLLFKNALGIKEAFTKFTDDANILNYLGFLDQLQDAGGFVVNTAKLSNGFKSDGSLKWQTLETSVTYTVQKSDNLTGIANRLNTTVEELAKQNNIKDVDKIDVGQKITYSTKTYDTKKKK